jgi:hypothetical protein
MTLGFKDVPVTASHDGDIGVMQNTGKFGAALPEQNNCIGECNCR